MTAYRVLVAGCKDLSTVTLICPECGTRTSFDHLGDDHLPGTHEPRRIPKYCASCETPFDDRVLEAVHGLMTFHRAAVVAEEKAGKPLFQFELRQSE
jgi:hypothetical protein